MSKKKIPDLKIDKEKIKKGKKKVYWGSVDEIEVYSDILNKSWTIKIVDRKKDENSNYLSLLSYKDRKTKLYYKYGRMTNTTLNEIFEELNIVSAEEESNSVNVRRKYNSEEKAILLAEVDRVCPICGNKLVIEKEGKIVPAYQIAHIYPHSPSKNELNLLKNEKRLTSNPEDIDNLIMLCPTCHTRHDKNTTVEEYRELVQKKQHMIEERKCRELYGDYTIEEELQWIIQSLSLVCRCYEDTLEQLNMSALRVDEKADETLDVFTKNKIKNDISVYYLEIEKEFKEIDKDDEGIADTIACQVLSFYKKLKRSEKNKTNIYEKVSEWIYIKTGRKNKQLSEIITSFFVQHCEVLS